MSEFVSVAHKLNSKQRTGDVAINEQATFSSLLVSKVVLAGLTAVGFERPSPIQLKAIPLGRCGFDLIVQAKSGTGKTCVFAVVALESIDLNCKGVQVIVVAPTREIAVQSWEVICSIGKDMENLRCYTFIGGLPIADDLQKLKKCHIAVATPGRLKQLIETSALSTENVRMFILDEADKLMEDSFQEVVNWIYWSLPSSKQMLALSATYPRSLADHMMSYMRDPMCVRLCEHSISLLGMEEHYILVPHHPVLFKALDYKTNAIVSLLSAVDFQQCLIFSNYQLRAQSLSEQLRSKGWPCAYINAGQDQPTRLAAIAKLKQFHCRVLVSTDLTARGIDAENVNLIINMDVPNDHETYLHRIGRAGRYGTYGLAVSIVSEGLEVDKLKKIEELCHTSITLLPDPCPADIILQIERNASNDLVKADRLVTITRPSAEVDATSKATSSEVIQNTVMVKAPARTVAHLPGSDKLRSDGTACQDTAAYQSLSSSDASAEYKKDAETTEKQLKCEIPFSTSLLETDIQSSGDYRGSMNKLTDCAARSPVLCSGGMQTSSNLVKVEKPDLSDFCKTLKGSRDQRYNEKYPSFQELLDDYKSFAKTDCSTQSSVKLTERPKVSAVSSSARVSDGDWDKAQDMLLYLGYEYSLNFPYSAKLLENLKDSKEHSERKTTVNSDSRNVAQNGIKIYTHEMLMDIRESSIDWPADKAFLDRLIQLGIKEDCTLFNKKMVSPAKPTSSERSKSGTHSPLYSQTNLKQDESDCAESSIQSEQDIKLRSEIRRYTRDELLQIKENCNDSVNAETADKINSIKLQSAENSYSKTRKMYDRNTSMPEGLPTRDTEKQSSLNGGNNHVKTTEKLNKSHSNNVDGCKKNVGSHLVDGRLKENVDYKNSRLSESLPTVSHGSYDGTELSNDAIANQDKKLGQEYVRRLQAIDYDEDENDEEGNDYEEGDYEEGEYEGEYEEGEYEEGDYEEGDYMKGDYVEGNYEDDDDEDDDDEDDDDEDDDDEDEDTEESDDDEEPENKNLLNCQSNDIKSSHHNGAHTKPAAFHDATRHRRSTKSFGEPMGLHKPAGACNSNGPLGLHGGCHGFMPSHCHGPSSCCSNHSFQSYNHHSAHCNDSYHNKPPPPRASSLKTFRRDEQEKHKKTMNGATSNTDKHSQSERYSDTSRQGSNSMQYEWMKDDRQKHGSRSKRGDSHHGDSVPDYMNMYLTNYHMHMEYANYYKKMYESAREQLHMNDVCERQMTYIHEMSKFSAQLK